MSGVVKVKPRLRKQTLALLLAFVLVVGMMIPFVGCAPAKEDPAPEAPAAQTSYFDQQVAAAKGTTVNFYAYGGDEMINKWLDNELGGYLKSNYDITLNRVPADDTQIVVAKMLDEKQAGLGKGSVDVLWVNGENFATAKKNDLLHGPFTQELPNFQNFIDQTSDANNFDFGVSVDGLEVPVGSAQFVFVNDPAKTPEQPKNTAELLEFAKKYKGKVTYAAPPDYTGSVFLRQIIYDIVGYDAVNAAGTDKAKLKEVTKPAFDYLKQLKPYLWRAGKTYPAKYTQVDTMFFDGELVLDMSYDPQTVANWISKDKVAPTAQDFIFDSGAIGNISFFAIPKNAPNIPAALVVADAIISPELQASKSNPNNWGNLPSLDFSKLGPEQLSFFAALPATPGVLAPDVLASKWQNELPADVVPLLEEIWLDEIPG